MSKPHPVYLLAGGHWKNPGVMTPMFSKIFQALGSAQPRVAYVGAASGDSWMFYRLLAGLFKAAGAQEVARVLLAGRKADAAKARAQLQDADLVFVSGGDVEEGMRWLQVHALVPFFQKLYAAGKPFFGVSAGSIMLGKRWVAWADPKDDDSAALFGCLGLAGVLCDTHAEGEGWEELQAAVRLLPGAGRGYGIPTGGILRVAPGGKPTALLKPCAVFARRAGRAVRLADLPPRAF
jgi:peptidase E